MIYAHEFQGTLTDILEEYTAESLDLLMIAVIYLMSRGTMTKERRAIPLDFWILVQEQLNGLEGKARVTLLHRDQSMEEDTVELLCGRNPTRTEITQEPESHRPSFFEAVAANAQHLPSIPNSDTSTTPPASTASHPTFTDTYHTAISTLRGFIDEFIDADIHATLFDSAYPCGFVEYCSDPAPMYAKVNSDGAAVYSMKWYFLNKLCKRITRWANVRGIENELQWGLLLGTMFEEYEFEEEEYRVERDADDMRMEDQPNEGTGDEGEGSQSFTSPEFTPIRFRPKAWTFSSSTCATSTSDSSSIWKRRGIANPTFLNWRPRLIESTFPYPLEYKASNPVGTNEDSTSTPRPVSPVRLDNPEDAPAPFLLRLKDLTAKTPTPGSHRLLPPVDPRITSPDPKFKKAMKNCDLVWKLNPSGAYEASLVVRADKVVMNPREWVLRQDDSVGPRSRGKA